MMDGDDWAELEPATKAAATHEPVRFGLQKMRGARARGSVLLRKEALSQLRLETWRVRVVVGSGAARKHQIAIIGDPEGPFELLEMGKQKGGGTYRVLLPVVERFPDVVMKALARPYKVEKIKGKPALVIDLPACCFDARAREQMERRLQAVA